ncbi:MAG: sugar-binding protein [Clostridiales Family XIII bacterium]|nr:sugar-binding protein [Clostridiales Family XIII bacterium]
MKKKLLVLVLAIALVISMAACGSGGSDTSTNDEPATTEDTTDTSSDQPADSGEKLKVGVSMPTKSLQRWNQDGDNLKSQLEAAGYEVDLQYAGDNEIPLQVTQLEDMISGGCKVLVIAAIDSTQLGSPMEQAKEKNIPVIAYDRLIMNSDAVSYYASFDNFKVGEAQGQFIVDALDLENQKGPFNIEMFTGDPADNNVNFFFGGAVSVLQPYIDSGVLKVPSGQTEQAQCATENWNSEKSQARMENLISAQGYGPSKTKLDAVLSSNDSVAQGITNALVGAGYTKDDFPVLTGQDCDVASMKNMLAGLQAMSIFKDTRTLADQTVKMVDAILQGNEPEVNNTEDYDNGTGKIPSYLCDPIPCTLDNYKELLIDSGYYKEDELQ